MALVEQTSKNEARNEDKRVLWDFSREINSIHDA